jgi:ribosomal protein S12 methylthiotransferase
MPAVSLPQTNSSTPASGSGKGTYAFISLGCPKNLVDSERMLGKLAQDGYALQPDADGADVVVVNTCGFIEPARQESLSVIREMLEKKKEGKVGAVVVAGCLAERQRDMLLETVPEVDQIVGVFGREEIAQVVDRAVAQQSEQRSLFRPVAVKALEDTARLRITPRHYAYLKISEGCDRLCTYCAIPKMRGKHVTKPIEECVKEAKELAADGVRELIIVAQDTTYYGFDIYGKSRLADLLKELNAVKGIEWIRVLYVYPEHVTDEVLETMASCKKVIPYVDMPLQHINDRVLKRMIRRVNRSETEKLIARMRKAIPKLVMRTTFIVGFPGETEEEFQELKQFIIDQKFERAGVFAYSLEPGTPAEKLDGHIDESLIQARVEELMATQQEIAFEWAQKQIGQEIEVIIDGPDPEFANHYRCRSVADSPDIDCLVRLKGKNLRSGDIMRAKVTAADGYDLTAKSIGDPR